MITALSILAQVIHLALIPIAVLFLDALMRWLTGRLSGRPGAPFMAAWWNIARMFRTQIILTNTASPIARSAPIVGMALVLVAAVLTPSFTLGMVLAPWGDLLAIGGLLLLSRTVLALAVLDAGSASGGLVAVRSLNLAVLLEPALFVIIFALAFPGGGTNLDTILGLLQDGMVHPASILASTPAAVAALAVVPLTVAALGVCALADMADLAGSTDPVFGGGLLALVRLADSVRLLVWFNLIAGVFPPIWIAKIEAGLLAWPLGFAVWALKLTIFAVCVVVLRLLVGRLVPGRARPLVGFSLVCGALACVLVLAGMAAA